MALSGAALTLLALTFGAAPLFVVGVAFAALGLGAPAWVWLSARGAGAVRRLDADRVLEQEPLGATIEVRRGRFSFAGGWELRDPLAGALVRLKRGGRTVTVRVSARFDRRGRRRLQPPSLAVSDALELAQRVCACDGEPQQEEVIVLPRTERVRWGRGSGAASADRSVAPAREQSLAPVEVDGLRPYRRGTPAARIHWPALARGAGLLERRLAPDCDTRPLIVLDARTAHPAEAHVDAAVRAAASLARELARSGGCALLLPGERRAVAIGPGLAAWPAAHVRLALVEGGPGAPAPSLRGARAGRVFYVAARALAQLPPALRGSAGASVLVVPRAVAAEAGMPGSPSFEVSGCCGFALRSAGARRSAA